MISPSEIATFLECPRRHRYAYVEKPDIPRKVDANLIRGTLGHAALEQFYAVEATGRSVELLLTNTELAYSEQLASLSPLHSDEERALWAAFEGAKAAVTTFWNTFGQDTTHPEALQTEVRLSRNLPSGSELHGILDAVDDQQSKVVLMEFKFPAKQPPRKRYTLWSPQHNYYAYLLDTERLVVVEYTVCAAKETRRYQDIVVRQAVDEAVKIAEEVVVGIERGQRGARYGFQCERCPYELLCEARLIGGDE